MLSAPFAALVLLAQLAQVTPAPTPKKRTKKPASKPAAVQPADPSKDTGKTASTATDATPATAAAATPSIIVEEPELDLGKIPSTELRRLSVTLSNKGQAAYAIQSVVAPCGCTTIPRIEQTLAPGEKLTIPIIFNPHGYWGPIIKEIEIHSSDLARPSFKWHFRMEVQSAVIPQPKAIFLDSPEDATQPSVAEFRFVPASSPIKPKSLAIEGGEGPLPRVEWHQEQGEVKGRVTLDPTKYTTSQMAENRNKPNYAHLVLLLEDGSKDWVDVYWTVRSTFTTFPQAVAFTGPKGLIMEERLTITSQSPFKILEAKTSSPNFQVLTDPAVVSGSGAHALFIRVRTSPNLAPGTYSERVVLKTDNPKAPEIQVPITATITAAAPPR